jgi:hypothetical protein
MKPQLHPQAASNFDSKADNLLAAVALEPPEDASEPPTDMFRPGGHPIATFTEEDYIEFKVTGKSDRLGRTTARYFETEEGRVGLEDERYELLVQLSESIQKTKEYRELVSTKWVEDRIVDWLQTKHESATAASLTKDLADRCEEDVAEHELWFPVSYLSVETDLVFGDVVFKTITEEFMDRLAQDIEKSKEGHDASYAAKMDMRLERQRADLQGLAAATVRVNAEPERAYELALQKSEQAVAALRVYQVSATTTPEVASYCALLGTENLESIKSLEIESERIIRTSERPVGKPVLHWHLSDDEIRDYTRKLGFDKVNQLLATKKKTRFQETLLDALLLYSRSAREKDLADKFVYMFAAMESVLLRNDTEPIQQNIGERMAFLIASNIEARKAIISRLKAAYALRSKFVHHGQTIEDRDIVWHFMVDTWALFTTLAKVSQKYETKEELIEAVEDRRLS